MHPAATTAAKMANGLRMAGYRSPDQLQFQPGAQGRQTPQAPTDDSPRGLPTVNATRVGRFPVRPVGVLSALLTLNDGFHSFLLLSCSLRFWVGH